MSVQIHFHGAAGTVTGSSYRVTHPKGSFLVDCGLFQGNKTVRDLNRKPLPYDPAGVDFLLLTHAHIDHAGLLPKLVKNGFSGPMHATAPSVDLLSFMLPDSAYIQESEAARENRRRQRKGREPVVPMYGIEDAKQTLEQLTPVEMQTWIEPGPGVKARYWNAGHILGSASIEVHVEDENGDVIRILFSGDIGPDEKVFYLEPDAPSGFDYILCESTYGGRNRDDYTLEQRREALKNEIVTALERGGNLVIPSFAVERSQELLHDIGVMIRDGEIAPKAVFLDSPLARKVTSVFKKYAHTLEDMELHHEELFTDDRFRIIESVEESKAINKFAGGAIILSASGMCDAGRIKHHLRNNLWRKNATVLFVGYQAPGTLGHVIQSGKDEVRIHGDYVTVKADIRTIGNYSAHGDHDELMSWIAERLPAHGAIFLTHGEDEGRDAMTKALAKTGLSEDKLISPTLDEVIELKSSGIGKRLGKEADRIDMAQICCDWHNDYAQFTIDLNRYIATNNDDKARFELMQKLKKALSDHTG